MPGLELRKYGENSRGDYYYVGGVTVVTSTRSLKLCCLRCKSGDCEHARMLQRHLDLQPVEVGA